MRNIIDYIKEELKTFDEKPLNQVDSLIFSNFVYINLDNFVPLLEDLEKTNSNKEIQGKAETNNEKSDKQGKECKEEANNENKPNNEYQEIEIRDILKRENFDIMFKGTTLPDSFKAFIYELSASPRFRNVKIKYFINVSDKIVEKQFAAITFILNEEYSYIAFRGTDDTLNGWKEDFNMAFKSPIPSQEEALEYVNRIYESLTPKIYLGGHSKGGNLAVYTLVKANENIQNRIENVFSHDGPRFSRGIYSK